MKTTKTDRIILEWLKNIPEGDACYNIANSLDKDVAHIHRRLERMVLYKVLIKSGGYPKFYKINKNKASELVFKFIKCPNCNKVECLDIYQMIKTCNGCRKKFRIYKKHIVDIKVI